MNKRFRNRLGAAFIAAVSITVSHAAGMGGGPGGMGGQQGMMSHMASMGFEQHMRMMQENAGQMLSISEAGLEFYNTLTPEQQKKLNDMPEQMQGMHRPQPGELQQEKP
jgi:Spy/CpxP family protein refolding chaperone